MTEKTAMDDIFCKLEELSKTVDLMKVGMVPVYNPSTIVHSIHREATASFSPGDTAWMLSATALVLSMTIPGLALYYSGLVRVKNVLACVMQIMSIVCLVTVLWLCVGYSLAFSPAPADSDTECCRLYGDSSRFWMRGMTLYSAHQLAPSIPEALFATYELAFAIITPALICGSFADRMKYTSMLLFIGLWHLLVYCPIAHANWHPNGFLLQLGVLDYAGGNTVHVASGVSGLVTTVLLGNRRGFGLEVFKPYNILLTAVGCCMLWVGWFGFNAGSGFAANERSAYALLMTQISTSTGALSWLAAEWAVCRHPSFLAIVSGAIAGLVAITPACGYVDQTGAFFIGLIAGPLCYCGAQLKHRMGYDDALDAFGVHAIGGIVGGVLTGFFASDQIDAKVNSVFYGDSAAGARQLGVQLLGILFAVGWSAVVSYVIVMSISLAIGLRVTDAEEMVGLDITLHKETLAVHFDDSTKGIASASEEKLELEA